MYISDVKIENLRGIGKETTLSGCFRPCEAFLIAPTTTLISSGLRFVLHGMLIMQSAYSLAFVVL